jgi:hypothetical protein
MMSTTLKLKKLDADVGKAELMNALGATLGFAPCAGPAAFIALLDEKIDAQKEELVKLASMREMIVKLAGARPRQLLGEPRRKKQWRPGADTIYARILDLIGQHGILTRKQIINLLTTHAAGAVPLGSIAGALSKLAEAGMIESDEMGWRLCSEETSAAE